VGPRLTINDASRFECPDGGQGYRHGEKALQPSVTDGILKDLASPMRTGFPFEGGSEATVRHSAREVLRLLVLVLTASSILWTTGCHFHRYHNGYYEYDELDDHPRYGNHRT